MPFPVITSLPVAPQRTDAPTTFSTRADAFVDALDEFVDDVNAAGAYIDAFGIGGLITVRTETGTSFTLASSDNANHVLCTNAATVTVTLPLNATVAIPVGTCLSIEQNGAGQVQLAASGGVTLRHRSIFNPNTAGQYSTVAATKTATDTWTVTGDMEVA